MCSIKSSDRYDAKNALKHPWMTGEDESQMPMTK